MKKKMLLILLAVTVSVATIAAATMAWFTDQDTAGTAIFTAGTVKVDVSDEVDLDEQDIGNVNPGDTYNLKWTIENKGTKNMVFKVDVKAYYKSLKAAVFAQEGDTDIIDEVTGGYDNGIVMKNLKIGFVDDNDQGDGKKTYYFVEHGTAELLETPNWTIVYTGPDRTAEEIDNNDWSKYKDLNNFKIYYTGAPLAGSYNSATPGSIELELVLEFLGEETHNGYQGSKFYLGGTVEAVQSSNNAPNELWNVNYYNYLLD